MAGARKSCMVCFGSGENAIGQPCHECFPVGKTVKGAPPHEDRTSEVIELGGNNNMTVDQALDLVKRAEPTKVVIIGFRADGKFFTTSSSMTNEAMMWLLEVAKHSLIEDTQNVEG